MYAAERGLEKHLQAVNHHLTLWSALVRQQLPSFELRNAPDPERAENCLAGGLSSPQKGFVLRVSDAEVTVCSLSLSSCSNKS